MFGESFTALYSVNQTTGAATEIGSFTGSALQDGLNGLVIGQNGTLYGSGDNALYTIDTSTGATNLVGTSGITGGFSSQGDLAFLGGVLYESVTNGLVSDLAQINPATGAGVLVGHIVGDAGMYGLVTASNNALFGIDGTNIYSINTATGAGTLVQTYSSAGLTSANGAASETESVPCYLHGTRILGPSGEVPVEQLRPGDLVVTMAGSRQDVKPIKWIGYRSISCKSHLRPQDMQPVQVKAQHLAAVSLTQTFFCRRTTRYWRTVY